MKKILINISKKFAFLASKFKNKKFLRVLGLILLVVLFCGALFKYKALFIAARVNGGFISRYELNELLTERYGQEVLDELVVKKLVESELAKNKITATLVEVDTKIAEIEAGLNGVRLEELLIAQNIKMDDFKGDVALQLGVEKYLSGALSVTDEEVAAFLEENADFITAEDEAGRVVEAKESLLNQKFQQALSAWISELRSSALIKTY